MAPDDGSTPRPSEDHGRRDRATDFSRRQLLRAGSTTLPVMLSGAWLAACGTSHGDAHGDHTDAPHDDAPQPPHTDVTTPHVDIITPVGVHVDQPATHMDVN